MWSKDLSEKMHNISRIKVSTLNENFICGLCFGYLIDATTIAECLHSFCRSCIVRYLVEESNSNACPLCCQIIHKTKPLVNIRSDKALQNLVYKLIPGLYKNEMKQRRRYYEDHPEAVSSVRNPNAREELGDVLEEPWLKHTVEEEKISLRLQHNAIFPKTHPKTPEANDVRYLLCPAYVTIAVLKKFLRFKFDLPIETQVELFYSDELLNDSYSLLDVASLYLWRRKKSLRLYYLILDCNPFTPAALNQSDTSARQSSLHHPDERQTIEIAATDQSNSEIGESTEHLLSMSSLSKTSETGQTLEHSMSSVDSVRDSGFDSGSEHPRSYQKIRKSFGCCRGTAKNNILRRLNSFKLRRRRSFKRFANPRLIGKRVGHVSSDLSDPEQSKQSKETDSSQRQFEEDACSSIEESSGKDRSSEDLKGGELSTELHRGSGLVSPEKGTSRRATGSGDFCINSNEVSAEQSRMSTHHRSIWSVLPSICSTTSQRPIPTSCNHLSSPPEYTTLPPGNSNLLPLKFQRQSFSVYEDAEQTSRSRLSTAQAVKVGVMISHGKALPIQDYHPRLQHRPESSPRSIQSPETRKRSSNKVESENIVKVKRQKTLDLIEQTDKFSSTTLPPPPPPPFPFSSTTSSSSPSSRVVYGQCVEVVSPPQFPENLTRKRVLGFQDVNTLAAPRLPPAGVFHHFHHSNVPSSTNLSSFSASDRVYTTDLRQFEQPSPPCRS